MAFHRIIGAATLAVLAVTGTAVLAQDANFRESITVRPNTRGGGPIGEHSLTFSGPVSLPGMSLAAGTYNFRQTMNNVMLVTGASGRPYKMFITVPTIRRGSADRYEVVLGPRNSPESPRRILALFTPGETTGHEFVYPK
jgi:hypothetical protein